MDGQIKTLSSPESLEAQLYDLMNPTSASEEKWPGRIRKAVLDHWPIKVGAFVMVFLTWMVLAGQQNFEVSFKTPVEYFGLEKGLEVAELSDKEVILHLSGPRRQASSLTKEDVRVIVYLDDKAEGQYQIPLVRQNIRIPLELEVTGVSPKILSLIIKKEI